MSIPIESLPYRGLSDRQVTSSRSKYGINEIVTIKENKLLATAKSLLKEPMVLLLLLAAIIYITTGEYADGIFMVFAIIMVSAISLYQESRSEDALEKLKEYTAPNCKVIRDGSEQEIGIKEVVLGDYIICEEGSTIPADAKIIQANDFSVSEAILTGESLAVFKDEHSEDPMMYRGTPVATGLAIGEVIAIGAKTKLGILGESVDMITEVKTPLQKQVQSFVKKMVILGFTVFVIVWVINYLLSRSILQSLQESLTLAMSILPEEIPVAFTTFMALGAWRMMKYGVVVKKLSTVETLGGATVICVDKTGTITENRMSIAKLYDFRTNQIIEQHKDTDTAYIELINYSMWASEPIPFDPMEIAIHDAYTKHHDIDQRKDYKIVYEYPLGGRPPMMTHIFQNQDGHRIIAAKGAPEALLNASVLSDQDKQIIKKHIDEIANQGYRILGLGKTEFAGDSFPVNQEDFDFEFLGLIAFYDPPKQNIKSVFKDFEKAGIKVKIITGDNEETTSSIAKSIDFDMEGGHMGGDVLKNLTAAQLSKKVNEVNIFTRMFPEAKMRVINALKDNNEVVAMTGDGVNDGPALKAAHIGIAMGKRGAELAKRAAALVLMDDDLSKMLDAIALGRRIYTNLKKAIQYIISIHIPIILIVFIPLALGWIYPHIFTPVHVIMLELIMGPTCSIIYENEPAEANTMLKKPRALSSTFFAPRELTTSILQGLIITIGCLLIYRYAISINLDEKSTRTMVFITLMSSNIFLTLVNRSFYYSIVTTFGYKNRLVPLIISINILLIMMMLFVPSVREFFRFDKINLTQITLSIVTGFVCVIWYELVKWNKRNHHLNLISRFD